MIQTFSTGSRRFAPLTARGPAPGRACAPVSAPLQPGRCPCRAHSNEPKATSRLPRESDHGQNDASGGGSAGTGMEGAPLPAAGR